MRKVEASIFIHLEPEKVIKAFYDPTMLKDWWGVERSIIELKPGGLFTLLWNISKEGFGYVSSGIVKDYVEGSHLYLEKLVYLNPEKQPLGPMNLSIHTTSVSGGTELTIIQDGYLSGGDWDWYYVAVKDAWPLALKELKKYLESL